MKNFINLGLYPWRKCLFIYIQFFPSLPSFPLSSFWLETHKAVSLWSRIYLKRFHLEWSQAEQWQGSFYRLWPVIWLILWNTKIQMLSNFGQDHSLCGYMPFWQDILEAKMKPAILKVQYEIRWCSYNCWHLNVMFSTKATSTINYKTISLFSVTLHDVSPGNKRLHKTWCNIISSSTTKDSRTVAIQTQSF